MVGAAGGRARTGLPRTLVVLGVVVVAAVHPLASLEAAATQKPLCDPPESLLLVGKRVARTAVLVGVYCTAVGLHVARHGRLPLEHVDTMRETVLSGVVGSTFVLVTPLALLPVALAAFWAVCVRREQLALSGLASVALLSHRTF